VPHVHVPDLVLNGTDDFANQSVGRLLEVLPNAQTGTCDGDHHSAPWYPSFQEAIVTCFTEQCRARGPVARPADQHETWDVLVLS
jgi:hypothetical protein